MKIKFCLPSVEHTLQIGNFIGQFVYIPAFICLTGELGTGKTTFTKGLAMGFGIKDNITSPTFTLINEFATKDKHFFHFDLFSRYFPRSIKVIIKLAHSKKL